MVSSSLFNHRSSSIFSLLVCHVVVQESGELLCRPPPSPSRTWSALPSPQPPVSCRPTTQTSGNERVNCWDTQLTASRRDPYSKSRPPRSTPLLPALPPALRVRTWRTASSPCQAEQTKPRTRSPRVTSEKMEGTARGKEDHPKNAEGRNSPGKDVSNQWWRILV